MEASPQAVLVQDEERGFLAPSQLWKGRHYSQTCIVGRDPRPDGSAVRVVGTSSSAGFCIPVEQPS